jgi:hypothetical protein
LRISISEAKKLHPKIINISILKIEKLAGIDVGSNAIRLLIANVLTQKKWK